MTTSMLNRIRMHRQAFISVVAGIAAFLANGCVETYLPSVSRVDHNYLVVDGFLVANDSTIIKLSRTQVISDTSSAEPEPHATVEIEAESGSKYQLLEKTSGVYVAPPLDMDPHRNYRIHIHTKDDKEYVSEYVPLKPSPPLDNVTFEDDLEHDAVRFKVTSHDPDNNTHYYYWTYDETFYYVSASQSWFYFQNGQMIPRQKVYELYDCWKTNRNLNYVLHTTTALASDVVQDYNLLQVPQASRKLYFSYSLLVKQYALTEGAYQYWRLIKNNSESLGGLFDPIPGQAPTNITCLTDPSETVIGYFTATSVQQKRVFLTRQNLKGPAGPYEPTGYETCESIPLQLNQLTEDNLRGMVVIEAFYFPRTDILLGYKVMTEDCADCRKRGGVTVKPDYWN